jgi:hypothetical protein
MVTKPFAPIDLTVFVRKKDESKGRNAFAPTRFSSRRTSLATGLSHGSLVRSLSAILIWWSLFRLMKPIWT